MIDERPKGSSIDEHLHAEEVLEKSESAFLPFFSFPSPMTTMCYNTLESHLFTLKSILRLVLMLSSPHSRATMSLPAMVEVEAGGVLRWGEWVSYPCGHGLCEWGGKELRIEPCNMTHFSPSIPNAS